MSDLHPHTVRKALLQKSGSDLMMANFQSSNLTPELCLLKDTCSVSSMPLPENLSGDIGQRSSKKGQAAVALVHPNISQNYCPDQNYYSQLYLNAEHNQHTTDVKTWKMTA